MSEMVSTPSRPLLTPDQAAALIAAIPDGRLRLATQALWETACRPAEVLALRRADLVQRGHRGFLRVTNLAGHRLVPVPRLYGPLQQLAADLGLGPADPLLCRTPLRPGGSPQRTDVDRLRHAVQRAGVEVGLPRLWGPDIRRSVIASWMRAGMPVALIGRIAGYRDSSTFGRMVMCSTDEEAWDALAATLGVDRERG